MHQLNLRTFDMKLKRVSGPRSTKLSRANENEELRRAADRREVTRIEDAISNAIKLLN